MWAQFLHDLYQSLLGRGETLQLPPVQTDLQSETCTAQEQLAGGTGEDSAADSAPEVFFSVPGQPFLRR